MILCPHSFREGLVLIEGKGGVVVTVIVLCQNRQSFAQFQYLYIIILTGIATFAIVQAPLRENIFGCLCSITIAV